MPFKTNNSFNSTMMASFLLSKSEQKEQTKKGKYVSVSKIPINPEKKRKKHQSDFFGRTYSIIPNKRTAPNKRAPPPFSCRPTLYTQSAGLKKSTSHQPSACSRVNMVEPRSVCCERVCKLGMLLLDVVLTLGQRRTSGLALNNTFVC